MSLDNKFVFIESLPESASIKDREQQRTRIQSHAAIVAHQRSQGPTGLASEARLRTVKVGRNSYRLRLEGKFRVHLPSRAQSDSTKKSTAARQNDNPEDARSITATTPPSPWTMEFSGHRRDPFNNYPIPVTGNVEASVDFWWQMWMPSRSSPSRLAPRDSESSPGNMANNPETINLARNSFAASLASPGAFHIMVALGQVLRLGLMNWSMVDSWTAKQREVLYHKISGIRLLQEQMNAPNEGFSEAMRHMVLYLMTLELFSFDVEAFRVHLDAYRMIVLRSQNVKDGLQRQSNLARIDGCIVFLRAMAFSMGKNCPVTITKDVPQGDMTADISGLLPPGFWALLAAKDISSALSDAIRRLSSWLTVVNTSDGGASMMTIINAHPWHGVEDVLVCLEHPKGTDTERLTCLALFCLAIDALRQFRTTGVFFQMLRILIMAIRAYRPVTGEQRCLWIWAATVAAGSALDETPLAGSGRAVLDAVAAGGDVSFAWPVIKSILNSFLVLRHRMILWEKAWTRAIDRSRDQMTNRM
jgi:hypothetical protein